MVALYLSLSTLRRKWRCFFPQRTTVALQDLHEDVDARSRIEVRQHSSLQRAGDTAAKFCRDAVTLDAGAALCSAEGCQGVFALNHNLVVLRLRQRSTLEDATVVQADMCEKERERESKHRQTRLGSIGCLERAVHNGAGGDERESRHIQARLGSVGC